MDACMHDGTTGGTWHNKYPAVWAALNQEVIAEAVRAPHDGTYLCPAPPSRAPGLLQPYSPQRYSQQRIAQRRLRASLDSHHNSRHTPRGRHAAAPFFGHRVVQTVFLSIAILHRLLPWARAASARALSAARGGTRHCVQRWRRRRRGTRGSSRAPPRWGRCRTSTCSGWATSSPRGTLTTGWRPCCPVHCLAASRGSASCTVTSGGARNPNPNPNLSPNCALKLSALSSLLRLALHSSQ